MPRGAAKTRTLTLTWDAQITGGTEPTLPHWGPCWRNSNHIGVRLSSAAAVSVTLVDPERHGNGISISLLNIIYECVCFWEENVFTLDHTAYLHCGLRLDSRGGKGVTAQAVCLVLQQEIQDSARDSSKWMKKMLTSFFSVRKSIFRQTLLKWPGDLFWHAESSLPSVLAGGVPCTASWACCTFQTSHPSRQALSHHQSSGILDHSKNERSDRYFGTWTSGQEKIRQNVKESECCDYKNKSIKINWIRSHNQKMP